MASFRFKAARADGELIEGQIEARDRDDAARTLQLQGNVPIQIEDAAGLSQVDRGPREARSRSRATGSDIDLFTLQLATLLRAGLSLNESLRTLSELTDNDTLAQLAGKVNDAVRAGKPLSAALQQSGLGFDAFYINMVRAGESSGALDVALERLAAFRANQREMRQALLSALLYPSILLVLAIIAVAVLLAFVVPQFTELFAEAGRELPLLTRIVAGSGQLLTDWWWLMLAALAALAWWLRREWRSADGRARWDARILRVPLLGGLVRKLQTARFSRTLSTLLGNGVNLVAAMEIAREIVGNAVIARALSHVTRRIREGEGLARPLAEAEAFPSLAVQLIRLGEMSGKLEQMLAQVADIYERDVQTTLKRMLTLAEPVIIIGIALLVTLIILSVVLMILESNNLVF